MELLSDFNVEVVEFKKKMAVISDYLLILKLLSSSMPSMVPKSVLMCLEHVA